MSFLDRMFGRNSQIVADETGKLFDINDFCKEVEKASYHRLGIEIAIDLIGNAVARVDWNVFNKNVRQQNALNDTLNYSPNSLQTSTEFFKTLTRKLLFNGSVLIVEIKNQWYIADQFETIQETFDSVYYTGITINGKDAPRSRYRMNECIKLTYGDVVIRTFLESYMVMINDLASTAQNAYKTNKTRRFVISSDLYRANLTEVQEQFNEMMEKQLASFVGSTKQSAVYAKPKATDIIDMSDKNFIQLYDTRGILEDIFKTVANTFHIPPEYMLGGALNQTIVDNFLINAVYPIVDLIKEGVNRHQYTATQRNSGTLVKPDTSKSRIVDLKTIGTFIAQVFPTGAITLNDVATKYLQLDELSEDIKDTRVITKNYSDLGQFINGDTHDETLGEEEATALQQLNTGVEPDEGEENE
jgi:HK97 family phage portal protein